MDRGAAKYARSEQSSVATCTPQTKARTNGTSTPQSDYGIAPPSTLYSEEYPAGYPQYPLEVPLHCVIAGNMAKPTSPSEFLKSDANSEHYASASNGLKSDKDLPIDPSIVQQQSLTYPPYYTLHLQQGQEIPQYQGPSEQHIVYRPEWGYRQPPPMARGQYPGHPVDAVSQGPPPPYVPGQQAYSFVSIPSTRQHKRPRRRYEEIKRMYNCGWNGCEKAYGTLNHLNGHVAMQAHGLKRTPEEFKEIRKEWKAWKTERDAAHKFHDKRAHSAQAGLQDGQLHRKDSQSNSGHLSLSLIDYASANIHPPVKSIVYARDNCPMSKHSQYSGLPYRCQQGQPVYQSQRQAHYA